jgi:hypothetical protein
MSPPRRWAMTGTRTHLAAERAPCGRLVEGDRSREGDAEGLVIDDVTYACGCRRTHHEFHDGSVRITTVRHDGKILADEHSGDHEA